MRKLGKIAGYLLLLSCLLFAADENERKVLVRIEPEYPAIASKMNLHGAVKIKVWISSDGTVSRLEYIGGHPLLAESAVKALKNWKFQAGPKESTSQIELKF